VGVREKEKVNITDLHKMDTKANRSFSRALIVERGRRSNKKSQKQQQFNSE